MTPAPDFADYTIVLFSPLVIEQQAASLMLDEVHEGIPERAHGQTVLYTFGKIASHNVAIAGYPIGEVGIAVSGSIVAEALRDFPNLELGILVGIAAGIPSPSRDMRLGDVAVAVPNKDNPGVVGYDLVKVEEGEVRVKQWQNSTHALLRSAIASVQVHEFRIQAGFARHLCVLESAVPFRRPESASSYSDVEGISGRMGKKPMAHYGTILSGNGVIKSAKRRDELRDKYDGIAIEMEAAAGMTTRLPVAVIRGISDFADAKKNDEWHRYAAVTAAAYAKEMLIRLGPRKQVVSISPSILSSNAQYTLRLALPEMCHFVGRKAELAKLVFLVSPRPNETPQKCVVALWGLAGVGKSQLVSEFIKQQHDLYPDRAVFWLSGVTREAFEQSILSVSKSAKRPEANPAERSAVDLDAQPASQHNNHIKLRGLSEEDAVRLIETEVELRLHSGPEDALSLANMLSRHPLSLRLAVSMIAQHELTVKQYIDKWASRHLSYERPMDQVFFRSLDISFSELEKANLAAAKLITLFGFLCHKDLWLELCRTTRTTGIPDWLRSIASSKPFDAYYTVLRDFSFIEAKEGAGGKRGHVYEIHPAVHEYVRWKAKAHEDDYMRTAVSLIASRFRRLGCKPGYTEVLERLKPHVEQCMIHMKKQGWLGSTDDLPALADFAALLRKFHRYDDAISVLSRLQAKSNAIKMPSIRTSWRIRLDMELGSNYRSTQQFEPALDAYDRVSRAIGGEYLSGNKLFEAGLAKCRRGNILVRLGRFDEALQCMAAAEELVPLTSSDKQGIAGHVVVTHLDIINGLCEIYIRKGDLEKAEQYIQAASGCVALMDNQHTLTRTLRVNVGRLCVKQQRFATANRIFDYVIAAYTREWGRRDLATMEVLEELARSKSEHAKLRDRTGDGGDELWAQAASLWEEIQDFYTEASGS